MSNENCCTLVSAFCDLQQYQSIERPRNIKTYLDKSKHILALEVPMILFIEPNLIDLIRKGREEHCPNPKYVELTKIIPFKLEESPYYAHRKIMDTVFNDQHPRWKWPSYLFDKKDTPCYQILTWTKTHFLEEAIIQNPFSTEKFCWIDLGVFYIDGIQANPLESQNQFVDIMMSSPLDKITCLAIHGVHPKEVEDRRAFYRVWNARTAGGLICGGSGVLTKFISLFKSELDFCMKNGCFVLEEPIFSVIRAKNRELYNPFYGDYQDIFSGYRIYTLRSHMGTGLPLFQLRKCIETENQEEVVAIATRLMPILDAFTLEEKKFIIDSLRTACKIIGDHSKEEYLLEKEFEIIEEGNQSITKDWWIEMKMAEKHRSGGDTAKYIECCERAWVKNPFSVEPVLHICGYYLQQLQHDLVHLWAKKAITHGHRHPEIDKVMMIVSYYLNKHEDGMQACDSLILEKNYPNEYKAQGKMNLFWYVKPLPHISHKNLGDMTDIPFIENFEAKVKYNPLNPSIVPKKDGSGYYINCRLVNYHQNTQDGAYTIYDNHRIIRTRNMLLGLNEDLEVVSQKEIIDGHEELARYPRITVGLEDMRLFWLGEELCFSATTLEGSAKCCPTIVMGKIDLRSQKSTLEDEVHTVDYYVCMEKPVIDRQEKNWIPISSSEDTFPTVHTIYMFDPFTVLECDMISGHTTLICSLPQSLNLRDLRGSSGLIPYKSGFLTVTHQISIFSNRRYYFHRFVYFEKCEEGYNIRKITRPFYFLEKDVEFCSGLCVNSSNNSLIITFGVKDREAHLIEVKTSVVEEMLLEA